ncbi:hypothetical protein PoB_000269300 [Plakobranchus ocellatus]|uniref:Uncharacterized protein n=1 Tax=Plakobranchus ocellatus TaxID=259542 RepID=A0AAV3Y0M0_9GAST|nr:hypothetical protein PoB_000269300 [Plakobranchus ocellatus]
MATGDASSPCLEQNPTSNSNSNICADVEGRINQGPSSKHNKYYVNFNDDPTIRDYTTAVNANGHRGGEKGQAATDPSRGCSKCGNCPGLSLHYWR